MSKASKSAIVAAVGQSSLVRSGQMEADSGQRERVQRRLAGTGYRRPFAAHNVAAFQALVDWRAQHPGPLILDTGCGTGESTLALSRVHPQAWLIGVDKTVTRLAKRGLQPQAGSLHMVDRCCFVLADLIDLWRLMAAERWRFEKQYLLYPNPWPKPAQRLRRWPLHPLWPTLLQLSDCIELRTNWRIYADECEQGLQLLGWTARRAQLPAEGEALTPFEAKYRASGHPLWQVTGEWPGSAVEATAPGRSLP